MFGESAGGTSVAACCRGAARCDPDELVRAPALLEAEVTDGQPGARVLGPLVDGVLPPMHPLDPFRDGASLPCP